MIGEIRLSAFYKQPVQQNTQITPEGEHTYVEEWKGDYNDVLTWQNNIALTRRNKGKIPVSEIEGLAPKDLIYNFSRPSPLSGGQWFFSGMDVSEMDAGQNARIRFTYSLLPNDLSSGPQWTHQWSLRWESETVDVKAYCGNLSGHVSSETDLNMEGKIAQDTAIRQWEQTAQEDFNAKNNFRYKDPGSKNGFEKLNPAEKQIARKIMQAKTHVLKHYPILTDQREITVSSIIQLGSEGLKMQKPDLAILDPALEYPFKPIPNPMGNDGVWEWLPQGTEVTIKSPSDPNSKLSSFQCVDVYLGALSTKKGSEIQYGWDPNFYGGPAGYTVWKLGMA